MALESTRNRTRRMVLLAFFAAIIVVLQIMSYFIKIGPFNMSFVLIPIVIGGMLMGPGAGTFLGAAFGIIVFIACVTGLDGGGAVLFAANPFLTFLICMIKGMAAGFVSAWINKLIAGKGNSVARNLIGVIAAAILCPVVNTSLFCIGLVLFFEPILLAWAGGTPVIEYIFIGLIGINFIVELISNLVIAPSLGMAMAAMKKKVFKN